MSGFKRSHRHHLDSLPAYTPIEPFEVLSERVGRLPEQIIKLDANENPYGSAPSVSEALGHNNSYHIYPDADQTESRRLVAGYCGVKPQNVVGTPERDLMSFVDKFDRHNLLSLFFSFIF